MDEPSKVKSRRRISRTFLIWLVSFLYIALATGIALWTADSARDKYPDIVWSLVFGALGASVLACLLMFICWLCCWRNLRRALAGFAIFATLVAVFYTEEDWRGKRAWENCKSQLEGQGVVLDWNKFLPPPVPDDENFYTASTNILLRFKLHDSTNDPDYQAALANPWLRLRITSSNSYPTLGSPIVARIIVTSKIPTDTGDGANTLVVSLHDPAAAERARNLVNTVIGPHIHGVAGSQFYKAEFKSVRPAQIYVQAEIMPSRSDLQTLIPSDTELRGSDSKLRTLISADTQLTGANAVVQKDFEVCLDGSYPKMTADDYLKWSDQYVPAFADIREALKRPYAILPGDYSQPYRMPIPNFITMRALAQTLAQRAQCYLLLGEPDKALPELALIPEVCRILEKPPIGKPETLVEAMINVAISGLYMEVIQQGFQQHIWREPQLAALQKQLVQINLPPYVFEAFREQPARVSRDAEIIPLQRWFSLTPEGKTSWPIEATLLLMPHGWVYQNIIMVVQLEQLAGTGFDPASGTVSPETFDASMKKMQTILKHHSPYHLLANIGIPNYSKAWQTTAYDQTMVNEAQIVCALERYRLAHGEYPETLDALAPQFIATIPQDVIGGQPLHYRRTEDGKFLLYSVGWNETDDGGQPLPHSENGYINDYGQGDWVWPVTEK
jgi:hypothetical protein